MASLSPVRAIATDHDGTLTDHGDLSVRTRAQLAQARSSGLAVVLVTGRRWSELRSIVPGVEALFDAVVCENGAVIDIGGDHHPLHPPIEPKLIDDLVGAGVPVIRGEVIAAVPPGWDELVDAIVARSGGDTQIVRNRGEVMLLPAGCNKATGAKRALEVLGISLHNAFGIGDAENDVALLDACGWAATPATGLRSLHDHVDVVLDHGPDEALGDVLGLIAAPERPLARRSAVSIGRDQHGREVTIPGGDVRLLVTGGTRAGKSYFTGALVEELILREYAVLVLDPEGDYATLDAPSGPFIIAARADEDQTGRVVELLEHRFSSVVVDLTAVPIRARTSQVRRIAVDVDDLRSRTGSPQWVVIDEAHLLLGDERSRDRLIGSSALGCCLVTYQPHEFDAAVLAMVDVALIIPGAEFDDGAALSALADIAGAPTAALLDHVRRCATGEAVVLRRGSSELAIVRLRGRRSRHTRHREKYLTAPLDDRLWFHFRRSAGDLSGTRVGDVEGFYRELRAVPIDAVAHHARHHDFSAWFGGALQDPWTAAEVREAEQLIREEDGSAEATRASILAAVERRYLR